MNKQRGFTSGTLIAIFAFFLSLMVLFTVVQYNTQETVTVKITGKERVTSVDSEGKATSKYLIFTETETFENTDFLFTGKFNSSDFYGKIRENQTCEFLVIGWRDPFLSMYRNIIEMECK